MKIFGREPAVWLGVIAAGLTLLVTLGVLDITSDQTALLMAAITAVFGVITAYLTSDTMLGVLIGAANAIIALAVGFGLNVSPELTASIIGVVTVLTGFFQRTQTSPAAQPGFIAGPN